MNSCCLLFSNRKTNPLWQLLLLVFLCYSAPNFAQQSQKKLEAKRAQLQREIKKVNTLLFQSKKQEKNIVNEIGDLRKKISVRKQLIQTIQEEGRVLDSKNSSAFRKNKDASKRIGALKKGLCRDDSQIVQKQIPTKQADVSFFF
jgi:septal ring factor EnvC (AmiA/AmiB activator)